MKLRTLVYVALTGLLITSAAYAGFEYEGERNAFNRFHGHGKFTSSQGVVYEGNWVDGRRDGEGTETKPDGERYVGSWSNNQESGKGTKTWSSGDSYTGQWLAGKMQGEGTYSYANGDRLVSTFVANQANGKGVLTTAAGDKFEGVWKAGKRSGEFRVTLKDGTVVIGAWKDDKAPLTAIVEFSDGVKYTGPVRNGVVANGKGSCVRSGQVNPCEYKDGRMVAVVIPAPKPVPKVEPRVVAPVVVVAPKVEEIKPVEPPKPKDPRTLRGVRADGTQFFFHHNYGGNPYSDNIGQLKVEKDLNEFGAMRITAKGSDFEISMMVDEYVGESTYELKYFKASIEKGGETSYRTSTSEPGKLVILKDDGKMLIGTFAFTGYPNGNAGADKREVKEGEFAIRY